MERKISKEAAAMAATACATLADALRHYVDGDAIAFRRKLETADHELTHAIHLQDKEAAK